MIHPSEEELVEGYYQGLNLELKSHLAKCGECESLYRSITEVLDAAREVKTPERRASYGGEVWSRLLLKLPPQPAKAMGFRWWLMVPAMAVLLAIVFMAGMLTQQKRTATAVVVPNQRGLYMAMSDHLEQAQIVLTEVVHAEGGSSSSERERARDLITQNRILRRRAMRAKDATDAAVLDDVERVLVEVANSDSNLEAVRERMENGNLLFRVRISGSDARMKGERL